ncbi:MAG TPA: hypothetical protein VIH81_08295, partial [Roseiarcus sp.]
MLLFVFLLFAFIFSNRDFSTGYGRFTQKFFSRPREPVLVAKRARIAPGHNVLGMGRGALVDRVLHRRDHSPGFFFAQENVDKFWNSGSPRLALPEPPRPLSA